MVGRFTEILDVVATGFIFMMHGRWLLMVTGSYKYGSLHSSGHTPPPDTPTSFFFYLVWRSALEKKKKLLFRYFVHHIKQGYDKYIL